MTSFATLDPVHMTRVVGGNALDDYNRSCPLSQPELLDASNKMPAAIACKAADAKYVRIVYRYNNKARKP